MSMGEDWGLLRLDRCLDPKIRSDGGFSRSDELDVDNESDVRARSRPAAKSCLIKCFPDRLRTCAPVVSHTSADRARSRLNSCSVCMDKQGPVYRSGERESGTSQFVNTWFFRYPFRGRTWRGMNKAELGIHAGRSGAPSSIAHSNPSLSIYTTGLMTVETEDEEVESPRLVRSESCL